MTPDDAFLSAILEAPDDDGPRLIYADWLEERSDSTARERGEFIRLQCHRAALPIDDPERVELFRREQRLLIGFARTWLGPLWRWVAPWHFRRGFLERVRVPAADFLTHADTFARLGPLFNLTLDRVGRTAARLAKCPLLGRVTDLSLLDIDAAGTREFVGSSHLTRVAMLFLSRDVGDLGVTALARSPALPRLAVLHLPGNGIGDAGARALAESPHFPALVALGLESNRIDADGTAALARSLHLRLLRLDLSSNPIGDAGGRALADSALPSRLQSLRLHSCTFSEPELTLLASRFGDRVQLRLTAGT